MKKHLIPFILVFLLLSIFHQRSYSQIGVFYYLNENEIYPNSEIVDLIESENEDIVLLCLMSDSEFSNSQINLLNVNSNGTLLDKYSIKQNNLHNVLRIIPSSNGTFNIYGNTNLNKNHSPFTITINRDKKIISSRDNPSVYSTYISDVYVKNNTEAFQIFTKKGNDNKFGIELHKINTVNNKVEWLKTISKSKNEEANQIIMSMDDDIYILAKKYNDNLNEYLPVLYKLTEKGDIVWDKKINVPSNFYNHSLSINRAGQIIYTCGYTKNQTGNAETRVLKLNNNGDILTSLIEKELSLNGILKLSSGNFLIYGSKFSVNLQQVVTKGKYIIISDKLEIISSNSLTSKDKPDCDLNGNKITSSELLTANELNDGRIAIGGRVFMPVKDSSSYNQALLIFCTPDGKFK